MSRTSRKAASNGLAVANSLPPDLKSEPKSTGRPPPLGATPRQRPGPNIMIKRKGGSVSGLTFVSSSNLTSAQPYWFPAHGGSDQYVPVLPIRDWRRLLGGQAGV